MKEVKVRTGILDLVIRVKCGKKVYALKSGFAAGLATAVALTPSFDRIFNGYQAWVIFGVVAILAVGPTLGALISRGLNVIVGTLLGAGLSVPIAVLTSALSPTERMVVLVLTSSIGTSCAFGAIQYVRTVPKLALWEYSLASFALAFAMLLLINAMDHSARTSAIRAGTIALGLLFASVTAAIFPMYAADALQSELGESLRSAAQLVKLVVSHFVQGTQLHAFRTIIFEESQRDRSRGRDGGAGGDSSSDAAQADTHSLFLQIVLARESMGCHGAFTAWERLPRCPRWCARDRPRAAPAGWTSLQLGKAVRSLTYICAALDAQNRKGSHSAAEAHFRMLHGFEPLSHALEEVAQAMADVLSAAADAVDPIDPADEPSTEPALRRLRDAEAAVTEASAALKRCMAEWMSAGSTQSAAAAVRSSSGTLAERASVELVARANACSFASLLLEMAQVRLPNVHASTKLVLSDPNGASRRSWPAGAEPMPLSRAATKSAPAGDGEWTDAKELL
jgi:hypothetical protein